MGYKTMKKLTHYETGAVRDDRTGKPNYLAVSFTARHRYVRYMTEMAKKYGEGNWRKGIPTYSYEESLLRHISQYFRNKYENGQDEPEKDHLSAALFNLEGIIHNEEISKLKNK